MIRDDGLTKTTPPTALPEANLLKRLPNRP